MLLILHSQAEMTENPDAVVQALKFFMYSKKHQGPTNKLPYKIGQTGEIVMERSISETSSDSSKSGRLVHLSPRHSPAAYALLNQ